MFQSAPQELGAHVSCHQAAQLAEVTVKAVRSAIRSGRLMAIRNRMGRVLIPRGCLESWLDWVWARRGETDDPRLMSLREAMEVADCKRSRLYYHRSKGRLQMEKNQAGRLLLVRESFNAWLASLPPRVEDLEGEHLTLAEMANLVGLRRESLYRAARRGELSPIICRQGRISRLYVIPLEQCQAWIRQRQARFASDVQLDGELLTIQQASARSGVTAQILACAIKNGELPTRPHASRGGEFQYVTGANDLERYLAIRSGNDGWTLERLSRFTGFKKETLWNWLKAAKISPRMGKKLKAGRRWGFRTAELEAWLKQHLPPYSPKVAGLPSTLTLEEAAKLVSAQGGTRVQFEAALENEELDLFRLLEGRALIARYAFDRWCKAQGWTPSATLTESPMITVAEATRLTGLTQSSISRWVLKGLVKSVKQGKLYLIERESLEKQVAERARKLSQDPDLLTTRQVAQQLGCAKRTVLSYIHQGVLPSHTVQGRIGEEFRIARHDLEEFTRRREDPRMSFGEVSDEFGIDVPRLWKAAKSGVLATTRKGGAYRVERAEILRWLALPERYQTKPKPAWVDDPNLLTVTEVAKLFGISKGIVLQTIADGHLPAQRVPPPTGGPPLYIIEREEAQRCHQARWQSIPKGWLTIKEASQKSGLPDWALAKAIKAGKLCSSQFKPTWGKPTTYIKMTDLEAYAKTYPKPPPGTESLVEVAKELGLCRRAVGKAIRRGELEATIAIGRYYVRRRDIEEWAKRDNLKRGKNPNLLTVAQVAERYGVRKKRVAQAIRDGHLEAAEAHETGCGFIYGIKPSEAERCYKARWCRRPEGAGWLDLTEAAERCGLARATLHSAVRKGTLPAVTFPPELGRGTPFVQASELDRFMKAPERRRRS